MSTSLSVFPVALSIRVEAVRYTSFLEIHRVTVSAVNIEYFNILSIYRQSKDYHQAMLEKSDRNFNRVASLILLTAEEALRIQSEDKNK